MPTGKSISQSRGVRRIAIDRHFLDEVQTRLHSDPSQPSVTYTAAPVERHQVTENEEGVTLRLPALTALQLYHPPVSG